MSKPNIIFFMVDQLSTKWLEAASNGIIPTPNLDRLRSRGVTFTNCITSNPVCCPARATLATGLTTRGHGLLQNGYELGTAIPTFMRALQQNGWRTGALGKVHYLPHYRGLHPDYRPYGFDVVHNTEDARGGEWLEWVEEQHPEHYECVLATIWASAIPEYAAYGPNKVNLRDRIREIRDNFTWPTEKFPDNDQWTYALPFPEEVSQTAWITQHALNFIRQSESEQPIYAHISYVQPHSPFAPPGEYYQHVNEEAIPDPAPAEWFENPDTPGYFAGLQPESPWSWKKRRRNYFADIVHLDSKLGLVMDALEETGRMENTFLIFLSDHGELLGDHGFYSKGERHYDACIRVPLVIAGPGLKQGVASDYFVQLEDLCPTVLETAGLPHPRFRVMGQAIKEEPKDIPTLPGRSLLPICRGERPDDWRTAAYCESYNGGRSIKPIDWARTIRTHEWRYTFYPTGGGEQLFNLQYDPDEQNNLVSDPSCEDIRHSLRDQLLEMIVLQDFPHTPRDLYAQGVH